MGSWKMAGLVSTAVSLNTANTGFSPRFMSGTTIGSGVRVGSGSGVGMTMVGVATGGVAVGAVSTGLDTAVAGSGVLASWPELQAARASSKIKSMIERKLKKVLMLISLLKNTHGQLAPYQVNSNQLQIAFDIV
jgi:hypothetical protein